MRQGASSSDTSTAMAKPIQATRRAAAAPTARLVRSVTRYATGKVNAPQVSQSLIGNWTRKLDETMTSIIASTGRHRRPSGSRDSVMVWRGKRARRRGALPLVPRTGLEPVRRLRDSRF